jgi:hypothetical protein
MFSCLHPGSRAIGNNPTYKAIRTTQTHIHGTAGKTPQQNFEGNSSMHEAKQKLK